MKPDYFDFTQNRTDKESGPREKITCYLPTHATGTHKDLLTELRGELATEYGGFSESPYVGGWIDQSGSGEYMEESGIKFEVSYTETAAKRAYAKRLFCQTGELLGQTWVHIERSEFQAEHTKVR